MKTGAVKIEAKKAFSDLLRYLIVNPDTRYRTYYLAAAIGVIRGTLALALLILTGRACGKVWKEKRFPEKK